MADNKKYYYLKLKENFFESDEAIIGGLASVSDYSLEAPYDDGMTYSISLEGNGALIDLSTLSSEDAEKVTAMPS